MKDTLLMYARYSKRADAAVVELLDKLSVDELNVDRKSYYKSLAGLMAHTVGGTAYFLGLFKPAGPTAAKVLTALEGLSCPEGDKLTQAHWGEMKRFAAAGDQAMIDYVQAASEAELSAKVKIDWFGGNPGTVTVAFLLSSCFVHGTHHRGQISQILDSMGVEHDFSGLEPELFPS
jgi:uncharacterized damage-inducible protein DinB